MKSYKKVIRTAVLTMAVSAVCATAAFAAPGVSTDPQDQVTGPGASGSSSSGIAASPNTTTTVISVVPTEPVTTTQKNITAVDISEGSYVSTVSPQGIETGSYEDNVVSISGVDGSSAYVISDVVYGVNGEILRAGFSLSPDVNGTLTYGVYVNTAGFTPWQADGAYVGGIEDSTHIQEIQMALTGDAGKEYDVWYSGTSMFAGQHGWACNEQRMGTIGRNDYLTSIEVVILPKGSMAPGTTEGRFYSDHSDFIHISDIGTTYEGGYTGWVDHDGARYYFVDGEALSGGWHEVDGYYFFFNNSGALIQNVDDVIGKQSSYMIAVNKAANCATIYTKGPEGEYNVPVFSMLTSTGSDTPLGTFYTPEKYRWRFMINDTYTQWATRINGGVLFHSITYETTDPHTLITDGFNLLGVTESHGCVRLLAKNAKWVYDNCALGTRVDVYNDVLVPGPFFKPYQKWIPADQNFDPTDPSLDDAVD